MPDLCLETFGLAEKGISYLSSDSDCWVFASKLSVLGPEWDGQCVKDHRSRILPVKFGKTDSNSPDYCINKCKSRGGYTFQNLTAAHWPPQNLLVGTIW